MISREKNTDMHSHRKKKKLLPALYLLIEVSLLGLFAPTLEVGKMVRILLVRDTLESRTSSLRSFFMDNACLSQKLGDRRFIAPSRIVSRRNQHSILSRDSFKHRQFLASIASRQSQRVKVLNNYNVLSQLNLAGR